MPPETLISDIKGSPKRNVKRRKPGLQNPLDVALEPASNVRGRKRPRRLPPAEALLQREYQRALDGSASDLTAILRRDEANREALEWYRVKYADQFDYPYFMKAMEAALILDIFRTKSDLDDSREFARGNISFAWWDWQMELLPWTVSAAREADHFEFHQKIENAANERISKLSAKSDDLYLEEEGIRTGVMEDIRRQRELGGRFQPGISGNIKGRAVSIPDFVPPFPWLEEIVLVEDLGRPREMTRCEALIWHLLEKARTNLSLERRLCALLTNRQLAIWEQKGRDDRDTREAKARYHERMKVPETIYQCMRGLGMLSQRAKKGVLFEHWLVELALSRLGDRRLSPDQQRIVMLATRRPHDHLWPDWWDESLFGARGRRPGLPRVECS